MSPRYRNQQIGNWTQSWRATRIQGVTRVGGQHHENACQLDAARHAAHANAVDHPARFTVGLVVIAVGAALWLAEVARMLGG
jgi:hypothetical protein